MLHQIDKAGFKNATPKDERGGADGSAGRVAPSEEHASSKPSLNTAASTKNNSGTTSKPLVALKNMPLGLSAKLLLFTVAFVMVAEILIFVPSVANFRVNWLTDRLTASHLAALAAGASGDGTVPKSLRDEMLRTAKVYSIAVKRFETRRMILNSGEPIGIYVKVDLRQSNKPRGFFGGLGRKVGLIWDALCVFFARDDRMLRVMGQPGADPNEFIDIVLPEAPLKTAMVQYGLNVLLLSVIISIFTAALVYLTLDNLLVRPISRITHNMLAFSQKPEDVNRIIKPSERTDEVGIAERELSHMQSELANALHQKNRLAALGLAVSKINHDLRNMLASAQLISDRLATLPDPTVQRFAPKLIASLDRAITFCNDSLKFGRTQEDSPRRSLFALAPLVTEVGDSLGLPHRSTGGAGWRTELEDGLLIDADRDQLYRVLSNLCRNGAQAIEAQPVKAEAIDANEGKPGGEVVVSAKRVGRVVELTISDDGPGIPKMARESLFKAFQGSTRKGGSGLGLAIAQELIEAHGGTIDLVDTQIGTSFQICLPDRVL